jgi:molecular chaperone HscB
MYTAQKIKCKFKNLQSSYLCFLFFFIIMYYFSLLNLPIQWQPKTQILNANFLALQKKYHPDFFVQATDDEQLEALEKSSEINKAYATLSNPNKTLAYILQEQQVITPDEKFTLPPTFLMAVMELNEDFDTDNTTAIQQLENEIYSTVEPIFKKEISHVTTAEWQQLKTYYYQKKYLQRILDRQAD